jgi:hypothetical protein
MVHERAYKIAPAFMLAASRVDRIDKKDILMCSCEKISDMTQFGKRKGIGPGTRLLREPFC